MGATHISTDNVILVVLQASFRVSWRRQLLTRPSTFYTIVLNKPHCSFCEHPASCYNWLRNNVRCARENVECGAVATARVTRGMNVPFIYMSFLVLIMVVTCHWSVIKRTFIPFGPSQEELLSKGLTLLFSYSSKHLAYLAPLGYLRL